MISERRTWPRRSGAVGRGEVGQVHLLAVVPELRRPGSARGRRAAVTDHAGGWGRAASHRRVAALDVGRRSRSTTAAAPVERAKELRGLGRLMFLPWMRKTAAERKCRWALGGTVTAHDAQPIAGPSRHDRGPAARGPRTPDQRLEHEARFVEEGEGGVQTPRFFIRGQAFFRQRPMAFIALAGLGLGLLRTPPQAVQDLPDVVGVVPHGAASGRSGRPPAGRSTGR